MPISSGIFNNLPVEIIIKIIENANLYDSIEMCKTNKKVYAICKDNQDTLCKIISKIPIRGTSPPKFYKCVKGLDYMEIIKFITDNNLVNNKSITKPEHIISISGNISLNVLKFLMANGVSMSNTVVNNSLSRLSLPALKFLIEDKKRELDNYSIQDVSYSKVKYLAEKGYLPHKEDIKLVKLNSFSVDEKKKITDLLNEKFKKNKPEIL